MPSWKTPVLRALGYLVMPPDWNDVAYYNMRYLKGLDGPIQLEDLLSFPHFGDFIDLITWGAEANTFTLSASAGGGIIFGATLLQLRTFAVNGQFAYIATDYSYFGLVEAGKEVQVEFLINNLTAITNQNIYLHISKDGNPPPSEIADHFGFRITNAAIYASNADGGTQKATDTTSVVATGSQWTRLRVALLPGTSAKFYVNDVLKITHTENLPTAGDYYPHLGIVTGADEDKIVYFGRIAIRRKY